MPATKFKCPNGDEMLIKQCLSNCAHCNRCMSLNTLETLAASVKDRGLTKFSVTELLAGTREMFLKRTTEYAVDPNSLVYAMHGSAVHALAEKNSDDKIITELRLNSDTLGITGQIDAYGNNLVTRGKYSLVDMKVTSSFKAMRSLGFYKEEVETGEYFKTGIRKGLPKTKKVLRTNGRRDLLDWAIQVNIYALMLREAGYKVDDMYIQMLIRDYSLKTATDRGIDKPVYLVKINPISEHWLRKWIAEKKHRLESALATEVMPAKCSKRETWNGRKCSDYCAVKDSCMYGKLVSNFNPNAATEKEAA